MNVRRLQGRLFVSVVPCPTQAGWVTERSKDISITIAISSAFYDSREDAMASRLQKGVSGTNVITRRSSMSVSGPAGQPESSPNQLLRLA